MILLVFVCNAGDLQSVNEKMSDGPEYMGDRKWPSMIDKCEPLLVTSVINTIIGILFWQKHVVTLMATGMADGMPQLWIIDSLRPTLDVGRNKFFRRWIHAELVASKQATLMTRPGAWMIQLV